MRRGRARGLGVTLVTQRPAVLNKDVLTQIEVLIAHGLTGPRDVAAIDEWVRLHADETEARKVKATLASLPIGTAWVWSPSWLGILQKVAVRSRKTFDSSATPKVGVTTTLPRARARIDLAELGDAIASTIERAAAEDPRALRKRIAQLEQVVARAQQNVQVQIQEIPVEILVPTLSDDARQLLADAQKQIAEMHDQLTALQDTLTGIGSTAKQPSQGRSAVAKPTPARPQPIPTVDAEKRQRTTAPAAAPLVAPPPGGTAVPALGKTDRSILAVLATYGPRAHSQVALLSGYSGRGGGFNNALGRLRSTGRIIGGRDRLEITATGIEDLGTFAPLPSGPALVDHWMGRLGKADRAILSALIEAWPSSLTNDEIAEHAGYAAGGGGFNNALGRLRTLELIHGSRTRNLVADELGAAARDGEARG